MDKEIYPASLTKLLTALTVLDLGELDDVLTVDEKTPYEIDGSHIALEPGEELTLEDMLHGLLIASANDAAEVIAKNYSSYEGQFIELMNIKAEKLGAKNSNFVNPHGLHDDNHYTTAYDLSRIAMAAYNNDIIRNIINKTKYTIEETNIKTEKRHLISTNKLLVGTGYGNQIILDGRYIDMKYEYANGMKTGYTPEAGSCFIGSAEKDGISLISVVIRGNTLDVYTDTHKLLNYGFNLHEKVNLINKNEFIKNIELENGDSKFLSLISGENLYSVVKSSEINNIEKVIELEKYSLPISKGDKLGEVKFYLNKELLGITPIISTFSVDKIVIEDMNLTWFALKTILFFILAIGVFIIILRFINKFRLYRLRKNKKIRR
jgi:D-alanyl-D-alanine carboxypeptidase (penicillin-binding protein 5/6)